MKKILIVIILVFILSGCNEQPIKETTATSTWDLIVDKEWSNLDNWAGSGFYFYEEDNVSYCVFMIYGSGVPVMYDYTSKVEIIEEGIISIKLPEKFKTGYLYEEKENNDKNVNVKLELEDGVIKLGDMEFKAILNKNNNYIKRFKK